MTIKSKFKRLARWFLWAIAILTVTVGALVISDSLHTKTVRISSKRKGCTYTG